MGRRGMCYVDEVVGRHARALDGEREGPGRRGRQRAPVKVSISLRVDARTVALFRALGPGWQTRMNEVLGRAAADFW